MKPKTEGQIKKSRLSHLSDPYIKAKGKKPTTQKRPFKQQKSPPLLSHLGSTTMDKIGNTWGIASVMHPLVILEKQ